MSREYARREAGEREQALLASCSELLAWDERTYLPPGGVVHRAGQMAVMAVI